jgi:hypothetical protein
VFKHGDLVEATISFAVIPTKNKTAKMHILLRALVLIDHTERDVSQFRHKSESSAWALIVNQAAAILKMRQQYKGMEVGIATTGKATLKQRMAYYHEDGMEVESTHREMQRLRLDNGLYTD